MKIFKATRKYESWLRKQLDVFEDDLSSKEQLIAKDSFTFLRGTFYRWMQLFPDVCKKVAKAPVVLSVGDLHAANFGTWRDAKDDLIWGINEFGSPLSSQATTCAPLASRARTVAAPERARPSTAYFLPAKALAVIT